MRRRSTSTVTALAVVFAVAPVFAQEAAPPTDGTTISDRRELINNRDLHLIGGVELEFADTKVYAEEVWMYTDEHRAVATGNVVFAQAGNRIAADRAEFDTQTRLGTFYNATGIVNMGALDSDGPSPGAPVIAGQETDVYFFGDTVERLGPKQYRIRNGGFTTCVQPTPRWILNAGTVVLNIDEYTLLRQVVFRVKGVPLLYLPILYYPTKEEQRATGFLLPTYGASTVRGQTISNAFFWAIGRSHDATIMHDWFSKTGQGGGGEYRYELGRGSNGNLRAYLLDERETTYTLSDGSSRTVPATRSYELKGGANHRLPGGLRARGRVDYFSSLTTMQTFNTNIYDASRSQRSLGGNLVGAWGTYSLNGTFDYSEYFYSATSSTITGSAPRVAVNRNERPLFRGSPVYFSVAGEYASLVRERRTEAAVRDTGTNRLDVFPRIRYPFKRWEWFTVNSSVSWRNTFYTRSDAVDALTGEKIGIVLDEGLTRQYFTVQTDMVGPILNRIWDRPGSAYAQRIKHTIEPFLRIERTSSIDDFNRIIQSDGTDYVVGGATRYAYGINNRIYAKRGQSDSGRVEEIVSVGLNQSYYTDELLAQNDLDYASSSTGSPPSRFSPLSLTVRARPSDAWDATLRAEVDSRHRELRTLSFTSRINWTDYVDTSVQWSQRFFIAGLSGFGDSRINRDLNLATSARTNNNRVGGAYSLNYDARRLRILQQKVSGFYNAQCCGIALEYQAFNFSGVSGAGVPVDRRFFVSFTLAGLGNFSPFSGAMENVPR
jgi:LPS-assembly protein